jgi:hypothetical protein
VLKRAVNRSKRSGREAVVAARRMRREDRPLPDFLIVGAQRGGTTSLYRYLADHPDVLDPLYKEIQFFSNKWDRGLGWYRAHFNQKRRPAQQNFEASPYYLYHPHAPRRVAATVPEARLIALLREPGQRAYSHYLMNVALGVESLSFEDALDAEEERLAGETERMLADETYQSRNHRLYSYIDRGRFADQLERWEGASSNPMLVVMSEDLYRSPESTFERVLDFLGLEPWRPAAFEIYSPHTAQRSPEMSEKARRHLDEVFAEPNRRLADRLGSTPKTWSS